MAEHVSSAERSGRLPCVVAAAVALVLIAGCDAGERPVDVTLEQLVTEQERFEGARVSTEGTVRRYDDPLHYWIEDATPHRVEVEPHGPFEDLVGQRVIVRGRFRFVEGQGRVIEVEDVFEHGASPSREVSADARG
jgi:hypothetical protein